LPTIAYTGVRSLVDPVRRRAGGVIWDGSFTRRAEKLKD
jgi:hypothetical protein